ncbi:CHAT domain-containing protein [Alteromonas sp. S015]|uniref:CHAT domain-containing protein n=1 Tax=Alteromonas sp. S015 TaxID=3117401 RepID=UPI002FDF23AD
MINVILIMIISGASVQEAASAHYINLTLTNPEEIRRVATNTSVTFSLPPNTSLLIEASQDTSDISLMASGCYKGSDNANHQVDIPGTYRQSEYLLIHWPIEGACAVTIASNSESKYEANTTISFRLLQDDKRIAVYDYLSRAGQYWFNEKSETPSLLDVQTMYTQALYLAKKHDLGDLALLAQFNLSVVYHYQSRYDAQAELLQSMLLTLPSQHKWALKANAELANYYLYETHDHKAAKEALNLVLANIDRHVHPFVFAEALELQASIYVFSQRYMDAISAFNQARNIYLRQGDHTSALNTALSMSYYYLKSGDYLSALTQYKNALINAENLGDLFSHTNANIKLATIYRNLGQFDEADKHIATALHGVKQFPHSFLQPWAYKEKARLFLLTAQPALAKDYFLLAQEHFDALMAHREVKDIAAILGEVYAQLGELDNAERQLTEFIDYASLNGLDMDVARTKITLANIYIKQNKIKDSESLLVDVESVLSNSDDALLKGLHNALAAIISLHKGNSDLAEATFAKAESLFATLQGNTQLLNARVEFASHLSKTNPALAPPYLASASELMQSIHTTLTRKDFKRGFFSSYQTVTSRIISLTNDMSPRESLLLAESMRGEVKQFTERDVNQHALDTQDNDNLLTRLDEQLALLYQANSGYEKQQIMQSLRQLSEERYAYEARVIERGNNIQNAQVSVFDNDALLSLQQHLDAYTAVVFVDVDAFQSHRWHITTHNVSYKALPSETLLSDTAETLQEGIQQNASLSALQGEIASLSNWLFSDIIAPHTHRIIFIGDGALTGIPVSVLQDPRTLSPIVNKVSVSRHFSLKTLLTQLTRRDKHTSFSNALVVSNPLTVADDSANRLSSLRVVLPELIYSEAEVAPLKTFEGINVELLEGRLASKNNLLSRQWNHFDLLHFATHGLANTALPELGGLVLATEDTDSNVLLVPEIRKLGVNAHLVVLSGCETSDGQYVAGDGMLGLSRAFYESGANNVIGSLWKVRDDATAFLFKNFYQFLLEDGLSIDQALRNAKIAVREFRRKDGRQPWRAPLFWAGFELHGGGI